MDRAFDVVVVPDFSGKRAHIFEARVLFFLASWLTNAGKARSFPLHVACIGEPPTSVRRLAEQCHASITIHEPMDIQHGGTYNKLRGLEVQRQTDRVLLLDVDVLVLSDISVLSDLGPCVAAAPAMQPRIPEHDWKRIYAALGMEVSTERIASIRGELGYSRIPKVHYREQQSELRAMLPDYSSGVLFLPWNCGLRELWEDHARKIGQLFTNREVSWKYSGIADQTALTTAIQFLRRCGIPFVSLHPRFHVHYVHIYKQALPVSDMRLFHAYGFGDAYKFLDNVLPGIVYLRGIIYRYHVKLMLEMAREWYLEFGTLISPRGIKSSLSPSIRAVQQLIHRIKHLHEHWLKEALHPGSSPL